MSQRRNRRASVEDRWQRSDGKPSSRNGVGLRWRARYVDEEAAAMAVLRQALTKDAS
jgi:hypothetical protein